MNLGDASILFVDDSADIRLLMSYTLENLGIKRCVLAESLDKVKKLGEEALKTDVAFLDINLGSNSANGLDVYNWLITNKYQGRVAFLTGYSADDHVVREILNTTKVLVLTKPVSLKTLTDFIKGTSKDV